MPAARRARRQGGGVLPRGERDAHAPEDLAVLAAEPLRQRDESGIDGIVVKDVELCERGFRRGQHLRRHGRVRLHLLVAVQGGVDRAVFFQKIQFGRDLFEDVDARFDDGEQLRLVVLAVRLALLQEGQRAGAELLVRRFLDILAREPAQLGLVEDGGRLVQPREREIRFQLGEGHLFGVALGAPAEQGDVVDDRLLPVPLRDEVLVARVAVALGELFVRVLHDGRQVDVGGALPAELVVHQVVFGRGGEILAAADDVRDAHQVVVHDVRKVIGGHPVALEQDAVLDVLEVDGDGAVDEVLIAAAPLLRHVLADDVRHARRELCLHLRPGQAQAVLVVAADAVFPLEGLDALLVAEAVIGAAQLDQLFGIFPIDRGALALHIRAAAAAHVRALVVIQPGVFEGVVDDLHGAVHIALPVRVLEAQDELAPLLLGEQVGVERGAQVADVHIARGAGRESGSDFFHVKVSSGMILV